MCKFWRERNHTTQNYSLENLVMWTTKNRANIAQSLQCYNSALCGWFLFKMYMSIPKLIYSYILLKVFLRNASLGGYLSKYGRTYIAYIFLQSPEVFNWVSENALISGFGKAPIVSWITVCIGSGNGSAPVQCQAITWTNTNFFFFFFIKMQVSTKYIWKCHLQNVSHSGPASMCQKIQWQPWQKHTSHAAYQWLSPRLQYLQWISNGDTAVLH